MPSEAIVDGEGYCERLTYQDNGRDEYQEVVYGETSADSESCDETGEYNDYTDNKKDVAGNDDNRSTIVGGQLLKGWRLRLCTT